MFVTFKCSVSVQCCDYERTLVQIKRVTLSCLNCFETCGGGCVTCRRQLDNCETGESVTVQVFWQFIIQLVNWLQIIEHDLVTGVQTWPGHELDHGLETACFLLLEVEGECLELGEIHALRHPPPWQWDWPGQPWRSQLVNVEQEVWSRVTSVQKKGAVTETGVTYIIISIFPVL